MSAADCEELMRLGKKCAWDVSWGLQNIGPFNLITRKVAKVKFFWAGKEEGGRRIY